MTQTAQNATAPVADDTDKHDELRKHGFTTTKAFMRRVIELMEARPCNTETFTLEMQPYSDGSYMPCIDAKNAAGELTNRIFHSGARWIYYALAGHSPMFY